MQETDQPAGLDELDFALINALQIAPRASWKLIGKVLGVNPVTAARRWERLTKEGIAWITAYASSPLMKTMPFALASITCAAGSVQEVAEELLDDPHAVTISHTVGTADLRVAVWTPDLQTLSRYLLGRLNRVHGIMTSRVWVATEMFAEGSRWRLHALDPAQQRALSGRQVPRPPLVPLQPSDRELVIALSHDGRASYEELAARIGASTSTVRRRLHQRLNNGALAFRCELSHVTSGSPVEATLWIDVPPTKLAATAAELSRLAQTRMCAAVAGGSNLVLTVWMRSVDELQPLEMEISVRAPSVQITERLLTLRHLKLMGRVLDENGRAARTVPLDIWRDPDTLGTT
jgi:DNA-binding Lrp family transcriptional regulator